MKWRQFGRLLQLARETPGVLRRPITLAAATDEVRERMATRDTRFLAAIRRLIYNNPRSPYRRLLEWAGCAYGDLEASVAARGVDGALGQLRDAGVYLTLDEFKGLRPIVRPGLTIETEETDFDNAIASSGSIQGATSGSRAAASKVMYDWNFVSEESVNDFLLACHHGMLDAPLAFWYPVLPSIAGVHNLLINLKFGRPPARWFSQVDPQNLSALNRVSIGGIRWAARRAGLSVPRPELATLSQADRVLDWMKLVKIAGHTAAVRTFVSSAVRLAERAEERGIDLSGSVIFVGGEPLTETRRRFIESAGWRAVPRYVATEPGLLAAGCAERTACDDMHFYSDRVAVIGGARVEDDDTTPLLITTLSLHTGKVLLNTDLGDSGRLAVRPCGCLFGRLGLEQRVSGVRSQERLTVEGMTVPTAVLDALLGTLVEELGGTPDSHQFWSAQGETGLNRLTVALSPDLGSLDEERFLDALYDRMLAGGPGLDLAARLWRQAGTIRIVREYPRQTQGAKLPPLKRLA
jgi:hypothetical protein